MNIDIIIVTFNRLEKLKHTLLCYENQTMSFRNLVVVNNNSSDGTTEFLNLWLRHNTNKFNKHVLNLEENIGGSGGFYSGQEYVMNLNPDWIFLADDDAYPDSNMIEQFKKYISNDNTSEISAICATVLNIKREITLDHRSYVKRKKAGLQFCLQHSTQNDYQNPFKIDILSYVGSFLNVTKLRACGLVNKDLFIYRDDCEHSIRLRKKGEIYCVPSIKIVHDSGFDTSINDNVIVSWRDFYLMRNMIYMLRKHYPLALIYEVLRICKMYMRQSNEDIKKMIITALRDGLTCKLGKHHIYKPGWSIKTI